MEKSNHELSVLNQEEAEDDVIQTDPSGRFERYRKTLGTGAYKQVFKAFDQEEGVEVAWNQIKISVLTSVDISRIYTEIQILQDLRNENIINLLYSWKQDKELYFITEFMSSGSLKGYIKRTKGLIKPKIIRNWCKQILNGLHYLHTRDSPIIHRDLKCENIFINGNNGQAKIGDLGLAVVKASQHLSSVLGTPEFMAPELYDEKYDEKVDIYAFGMVVLEIATKEYPYSECTNQAQIYKKVSSGVKPAALSQVQDPAIKAFVELCIEHDPKKRPSATELLDHPFFTAALQPSGQSSMDLGTSYDPNNTGLESDLVSQSSPIISHPSPQTQNSEATFHNSIIDSEQHHFMFSRHVTPVKPAAACEVEAVGQVTGDEITLKMVYHTGTSSCEINFPFNLSEDTATDVVSELVKENLILAMDEGLTRRRIEETIRAVLIKQRSKRKSVGGEGLTYSPELIPAMPENTLELDHVSLDNNLADDAAKLYPTSALSLTITDPGESLIPRQLSSKPKFVIDPIADFPKPSLHFEDVCSPVDDSKTPTPNNPHAPQPLSIYHPPLSAPVAISTPPRSEYGILTASLSYREKPQTSSDLEPSRKHQQQFSDPEASRKHQELSQKLTQLQEFNLKVFDQDSSLKPSNRSFTTPPTPPPQPMMETRMQDSITQPSAMSLPNPLIPMNFASFSSSSDR